MRIQRLFAALLAALVVSALGSIAPQPAVAATDSPITIALTATVDEVQDWAHALGAIQPGDTITGTYTYNAAATNISQDPRAGNYRHTTAPYGMRLNIGGKVIETDPQNVYFDVTLWNNFYGWDYYSVYSKNNRALSDQYNITWLQWMLGDPSQTALKNITLPRTAPKLSDWSQSSGGLVVEGADTDPNSEYTFLLRAHVTQVQKITR
jgi:hypothetical protein